MLWSCACDAFWSGCGKQSHCNRGHLVGTREFLARWISTLSDKHSFLACWYPEPVDGQFVCPYKTRLYMIFIVYFWYPTNLNCFQVEQHFSNIVDINDSLCWSPLKRLIAIEAFFLFLLCLLCVCDMHVCIARWSPRFEIGPGRAVYLVIALAAGEAKMRWYDMWETTSWYVAILRRLRSKLIRGKHHTSERDSDIDLFRLLAHWPQ